MDSAIFKGKNVIVQGMTGKNGLFHTRTMVDYGTHIIAGVTPGKGGQVVDTIPVYDTIAEIDEHIDVSVVFVPAPFARGALFEAIEAEIPLIVCITEHIPVHDMLAIRQRLKNSKSQLIGPNCPGILLPGNQLLGIIPASLATPGNTAVVSRSGTLTYEAMDLLTKAGFGQKYIIGIGGDMVRGTNFIECLELFEHDLDVTRIVMIGEIGGVDEILAADYIREHVTKPVYAYVAGHSAPMGVQMGHAGAILSSHNEGAAEKTRYLSKSGAITADSITELVKRVQ